MKLPVCRHPKALAYPLVKKGLSRAFATERIDRLRGGNPRRFHPAPLPPRSRRLLAGGAIQFPGGSFIPLWTSGFHVALLAPDFNSCP
jgi:hypothetical protein